MAELLSKVMDVFLLYAGILGMLVGVVSLLTPLRTRNRVMRLSIFGSGLVLALVGAGLPAQVIYPARRYKRIDDFIPRYQFNEIHSTRVQATPDHIFCAIKSVTAEEIRFFRTLTWIRSPRLPGKGGTSILAAPANKPILDVALHSGFLLLTEETDRELVVGTIVCCGSSPRIDTPQEFLEFDLPDHAKAALNFHLEQEGEGWTRVTTETRVYATDRWAQRKFAVYWRVIYPGSALIRRMWLAAIKRRAERPGS